MPNDPDMAKRRKLLAACEELSEQEQTVLQLLSIVYEPTARTSLMQCANKAGIRTSRKVQFTSRTWKPLVDRLKKERLVVEERGKISCQPLIVEVLTRQAVRQGRFEKLAAAADETFPGPSTWKYFYYNTYESFLRDLRLALYRGDLETLEQVQSSQVYRSFGRIEVSPWERICNNPFDREWMVTLPTALLEDILYPMVLSAHAQLQPVAEPIALIEELCAAGTATELLHFARTQHLVLTGQLEEAYELARERDDANHLVLRAWLHTLAGDDDSALPDYEAALARLKKESRKRKIYFYSLSGVYFILALLRANQPERLQQAADYISIATNQQNHPFAFIYLVLQQVVQLQQGWQQDAEWALLWEDVDEEIMGRDFFFVALARYWMDAPKAKPAVGSLERLLARAEAGGYVLIAAEIAELLYRLTGAEECGLRAENLRQELGVQSIADAVVHQEPWQRALKALAGLRRSETVTAQPQEVNTRLVWLVDYQSSADGTYVSIAPREQKSKKNGGWTQGRAVALKRLFGKRQKMDFLTEQDERVCLALEGHQEYRRYGYYGQTVFSFNNEKALPHLVGHPLVFLQEDPSVRVELVGGEPELQVVRKGQELLLELTPAIDAEANGVALVRETPTRFKVVSFTPEHRRIAAILGDGGLRIPARADEETLEALTAVSSLVTVHSEIGGGTHSAEEVEAETRPHLHLLPFGEGLQAELLVQPLGPEGPACVPGSGGATVFAEIGGRHLQALRDLQEERRRAAAVQAGCAVLQRLEEVEGQWSIADPQDCLELLLELRQLGDEVVVEWPQGEQMQVRYQASFSDLALDVRRQNDWFSLTGELRLDEDLVVDMRRLLELSRSARGRFLPLGDGAFIALTEEFREKLEEVHSFAERHGRGARFHSLAAPIIEELTAEAGSLEVDEAWKQQLARLQGALELEPEVPSTLQVELRDYQVEGFRWATRLAHWGVGACLADDMGLGKTVQALALILDRAPEGPTLVVAPTSVGANWIDETCRFAPTLRPVVFGEADRHRTVEKAGPFDLVVCSYGLLHQEEELLASTVWQTIVLDEAQAIKNMGTRRSRAAMALKAEFKMITTGTPIENHLGELWNLFRFTNAGLLGSLEHFNEYFAAPVEKQHNRKARQRLKRLIQPFILRRTKSQVLEELPPRTEISLQVEMGREEMAFYEALRQRAVETLSSAEAATGYKPLQILAEIMRLRRACCHARLVLPDASVPSAKMEVFGEVLDELLENRHKVLVFSQFVDYLSIVRQYLDGRGIFYQYLDGSTPVRARKKRVDAFQAGQGDIFLISLKAGGQGLNLTAADYVIHMDPWWNPAVEDQASDRVHRIGQERPVTIYRLVTQGTIEEKIVDLHRHKRDLADSLLEGSDTSGKLSTKELLRLIREG